MITVVAPKAVERMGSLYQRKHMKINYNPLIRRLAIFCVAAFANVAASAQNFPSKPITTLVPFAPSGPTDNILRNVAQKMTEALGATIVVDNRPGGGGLIAAAVVKQSRDMMFDVFASSGPSIATGKLKALAVASPRSFASLPGVPRLAEDGATGLDASVWFGVAAPVGTPDDVVATLTKGVTSAVSNPELVKRFGDLGIRPLLLNPREFAAFIKGEIDRWTPIVKASGAEVG